jgi:hypothetical protein
MEKKIETQPTRAASDTLKAQLVLEKCFQKLLDKFPSENALVVHVQYWIYQWFALDDVYMNDIAVPKFVENIILHGRNLRSLSDNAILQYLSIQNVRLNGCEGQLYPTDVINKLVEDILEARRRALPDWNGVGLPSNEDKKRWAIMSSGSKKMAKLMNISTDERGGCKDSKGGAGRGNGKGRGNGEGKGNERGKGSGTGSSQRLKRESNNEVNDNESGNMGTDDDSLGLTGQGSSSIGDVEAPKIQGQLSTLVVDAELGLGFSLIDSNGPTTKPKRKREVTHEVRSLEEGREEDMQEEGELTKKVEKFKRTSARGRTSKPTKSSGRKQHTTQSTSSGISSSNPTSETAAGVSRAVHSAATAAGFPPDPPTAAEIDKFFRE